MERSPLSTLAALGVVAAILLAAMYLFAVDQVADTTTKEMAADIDTSLARSLAAGGSGSRVTMFREGKGLDAPRRYVVRYRPSDAVGADPQALARLAERAAQIIVGRTERVRAVCLIHCVAERSSGAPAEHCFRREGTEGMWRLEPVDPVPPLPAAQPRDGDAPDAPGAADDPSEKDE